MNDKFTARDDARDLKRGVIVNLLGYLVKAAHPILLVLVVREFGAERFGVFTLTQAVSMFVMRIALVGMDKAVLWWVPRQHPAEERKGLRAMLGLVVASACLASAITATVGTWVMDKWHGGEAAQTLRIMSFALLPMALTEILLHATLGKRDMVAKVVVRETVVPFAQVLIALLLSYSGTLDTGLAVSYLASHGLGAIAALAFFRRRFADSRFDDTTWPPPKEVVRYAVPMWGTEMVNTVTMRLDVYMLAALADARAVGIYAAVTQIGNTLRAIRQSFDHIVVALFSQISSRGDVSRLRAGFSRATIMVMVTQMPVYAFLFLFAAQIMPLFGEGFGEGTDAVLILAGASVANGIIALHGLILVGYGRSDLILANMLTFGLVQAGLHALLIPRFGVTGAALAAGINLTLQNLLQWYQAAQVSRVNPYNRSVLVALRGTLLACAAMLSAWFALGHAGDMQRRIGAMAAFIVAGAFLFWRTRKVLATLDAEGADP